MKVLAVLFLFVSLASALDKGMPLPNGAALTLPAVPGTSAQWILPPAEENSSNARFFGFDVDQEGDAWIGREPRDLLNASSRAIFRADRDLNDFAWLENGQFVASSEDELGYLDSESLEFKPMLKFPVRPIRIHPGAGGLLYMVGENQRGGSEVYSVDLGEPKGRVVKLLSGAGKVSAVTGNGQWTYVAMGRRVFKLKGASVHPAFTHPSQDILSLAYSPKAGLFYATASAVGFVAEQASEFMECPGASLRLRGDSLYIFMSRSLAVLRIQGLDGFNTLATEERR